MSTVTRPQTRDKEINEWFAKLEAEENRAEKNFRQEFFEDTGVYPENIPDRPNLYILRYKEMTALMSSYNGDFSNPFFDIDEEHEDWSWKLAEQVEKIYDNEYRLREYDIHPYEPDEVLCPERAAIFVEWLKNRLPGLKAKYIGPVFEAPEFTEKGKQIVY